MLSSSLLGRHPLVHWVGWIINTVQCPWLSVQPLSLQQLLSWKHDLDQTGLDTLEALNSIDEIDMVGWGSCWSPKPRSLSEERIILYFAVCLCHPHRQAGVGAMLLAAGKIIIECRNRFKSPFNTSEGLFWLESLIQQVTGSVAKWLSTQQTKIRAVMSRSRCGSS